jgi:hypothetical protein
LLSKYTVMAVMGRPEADAADATTCRGELTAEFGAGELTVTPAKAIADVPVVTAMAAMITPQRFNKVFNIS